MEWGGGGGVCGVLIDFIVISSVLLFQGVVEGPHVVLHKARDNWGLRAADSGRRERQVCVRNEDLAIVVLLMN